MTSGQWRLIIEYWSLKYSCGRTQTIVNDADRSIEGYLAVES
jgi:hypothetical protein